MEIFLIFIAFFCEFTDSTLGMGYGTTLTPILLLMGFSPLQIVPTVLLSELITGSMAGFFHHKEGNIDFSKKQNLKTTIILSICGVVGTLIAVCVAVSIPKIILKGYIGILVFSIGIFMIICLNKSFKFSYKKIWGLGMLASFNKGMSGGGYGPLVCPGQILSGVKPKAAVAITSVSEAVTCLVGILGYFFISHRSGDWNIAPYIILGAILSVPISAKCVKIVPEKMFKLAVAILTIILGAWTIWKLF